jgi:hypothetical protein
MMNRHNIIWKKSVFLFRLSISEFKNVNKA